MTNKSETFFPAAWREINVHIPLMNIFYGGERMLERIMKQGIPK